MPITGDGEILGGVPRIEGTRIGVRHIAARVVDADQSPAYVADQLEISLSEVYEALSYYYGHVKEIGWFSRENQHASERISADALQPKEPIK